MTPRDYLDVPEWLAVGKQVFEQGRPGTGSFPEVLKHTPTQVVLENDHRYRRFRQVEGHWNSIHADHWDYGHSVFPVDSDRAREFLGKSNQAKADAVIERAYNSWVKDRTAEKARALADAASTWGAVS